MRRQSGFLVAGVLSMAAFSGAARAQQRPAAPAVRPAQTQGARPAPAQGTTPAQPQQGNNLFLGNQGRPVGQAKPRPSEPAPRDASGKIIIGGMPNETKGLWLPGPSQIADPKDIPFQPWAKALYDFRQTTEMEPHTRCKASGGPRQFITPYGVEITEIAELQRVFIFDIGGPHTYRTVYMDGRGHPAKFSPSNYGHSIGWWEGDTLVIDTVGFNEDFWFERRGLPHTETLHMMERLTRKTKETMEYRITIDDPGAYTKPFTGGIDLRFNPTDSLFEYMCQQANYAHELMVGKDFDDRKIDRTSPIVP